MAFPLLTLCSPNRFPPTCAGEQHVITVGAAAANYANPLGRASMQRPSADRLARASVITVSPLKLRLPMTLTIFDWMDMLRTTERRTVEQRGG